MKSLIIITICFITLLVCPAHAETIELYAEDSYSPFSNPDGSGIVNKVVIAAYREVGIDVKIRIIPFVRIVKWLGEGKGLGGFSAVKTPDSEDKFIFGEQPVYQVTTKFFYATKRPIEVKSEKDLNNSRLQVGEVNGYMYHPEYYQYKFKRQKAQSEERLIKMLLLGRVDLAYITEKVIDYHLSLMKLPRESLKSISSIGVVSVPLYVAFNKKHPKAKYYAKMLDKGLLKLKESGRYTPLTQLN